MDDEHSSEDDKTHTTEYVRLAVMGLVILVSLSGSWRPWLWRDIKY